MQCRRFKVKARPRVHRGQQWCPKCKALVYPREGQRADYAGEGDRQTGWYEVDECPECGTETLRPISLTVAVEPDPDYIPF